MNLNKYVKQAIVSSVIADIPRPALTGLEEKLQAIVDADIAKHAPPELAAMWAKKEMREWLTWEAYQAGRLTKTPVHHSELVAHVSTVQKGKWSGSPRKLSEAAQEQYDKLYTAAAQEHEAVQQVRVKLQGSLESIRTRKQFVAAYPELEKYAPTEAARSAMLPALANVVADLSKLGWPKDAGKAKKPAAAGATPAPA